MRQLPLGQPSSTPALLAQGCGQEGGQPEGWAAPVAAQARGCSSNKELSLPGCFSTVGKAVWPGWEAAANTGSLSGGLHGALLAPAPLVKKLL